MMTYLYIICNKFVIKYYTLIFLRLFNCTENYSNIMSRQKQDIKLHKEFVHIWLNVYTLKNRLKRNKLKCNRGYYL